MMDNLNLNGYYDNLQEQERAYKAEIMDEDLLSSFDLQKLIWSHEMNESYKETDQDFLQKKEEEIFASDQLLHLPLITSSSEDLQLIRNIVTFSNQKKEYSSIKTVMRSEDCCNALKSKKAKLDVPEPTSIDFRRERGEEVDGEAIARVKEMIYRAAALRPVRLGLEEMAEKPRRKNVRISSDPQTMAARQRRERISERLRVLQRLVPGGRKMDTASMLDEAANYLKFLKAQVTALEEHSYGSSLGGLNWCGGVFPFQVTLSHFSSPDQKCIFTFPRR